MGDQITLPAAAHQPESIASKTWLSKAQGEPSENISPVATVCRKFAAKLRQLCRKRSDLPCK